MTTSKTSVVGMKFNSSVLFGIDSRMCLIDWSTVASNQFQKTIRLNDNGLNDNKRFVFVGFSGDIPLLQRLKKVLPADKELKINLNPSRVAERIRVEIEKNVQKDKLYYGIVVIGIGETDEVELIFVRTSDWVKGEESLMASTGLKVKITLEKIDDFCVAGTGTKWLELFFKKRFLKNPDDILRKDLSFEEAKKLMNFPKDMSLEEAQKLVMSALEDASHNDPGSGGLLQAIAITKDDEGGFKCYPCYKRQVDYDHCLMPYYQLPNDPPPVFDPDDDRV